LQTFWQTSEESMLLRQLLEAAGQCPTGAEAFKTLIQQTLGRPCRE
jgi:hypothetical protein